MIAFSVLLIVDFVFSNGCAHSSIIVIMIVCCLGIEINLTGH